jgi:ribonuclease D
MKFSSKNYITKQSDLDNLTNLIQERKLLALDTEFTRQTTYYPVLSLIQVAVKNDADEKESFVIDCLSDLNLNEIYNIISNPQIVKILHSCAQDLQIFHHQSKQIPQNIMDTQLMANFCGIGFNSGYSHLVETLFQQVINKKEQNSDWQRRPLSEKQLQYAATDVIFLEEIYEKFCITLRQENYFDAYLEEIQTFINKQLFRSDSDLTKKISLHNKSHKQAVQIKNLVLWREHKAKEFNVPRQHFLRDETIEKIVMEDYRELYFNEKLTQEIEEAINNLPEISEKKKSFSLSEKQKYCYQEAKNLINEIAVSKNFKAQFLITSSNLEKAICDQTSFDEIVCGWRYQLFGKELQQLINS